MKYKNHFLIFSFFITIFVHGQSTSADSLKIATPRDTLNNPLNTKSLWVDSVFNSMTMEQKIGQLFMLRAHSNKSNDYHQKVKSDIAKYQVGGVCFFQGGPGRQIDLVNEYQKVSKLPMFVAIDGEWGVGMRLDSVVDFPRQMTLGATNDDQLLFNIGRAYGRQCKTTGVNIDFAPVSDVNSNPNNPIINSRSFGENPKRVAHQAWLIAKGMQEENIIACAKHFPGHGDAKSDSHKTLPSIYASKKEMDSIHLYPFRYMINKGIKSIMVAHLFIPSLDTTSGRASSLSPAIVNGLLFKQFGFKGLAITDALEMKGVSSYFEPGEIELLALKAGNDILLLPPNIDKAIKRITEAVANGEIDSVYFEQKVKKIIGAKYDLGLISTPFFTKSKVMDIVNSPGNKALIKQAYTEAITLVVNKQNILPLTQSPEKTMAVISIGAASNNKFSTTMTKYRKVSLFSLPSRPSLSKAKDLANQLKKYDIVVVNIMGTNNSAYRNYGISQGSVDFVNLICQTNKVVLNISGNPYSAARFVEECEPTAIVISYQDNDQVREILAHSLFGANAIGGKLPVSVGSYYKAGYGINLKRIIIGNALPEEVGMNGDSLKIIDSIVMDGIDKGAYPGAQVLIAHNGKIFYNKSFGKLTYKGDKKVNNSILYDLASVTKVMATTNAIMRLASEGKVDVDQWLGTYLPYLKGSNKEKLLIRDVMAHQARLTPWIPFYTKVVHNGVLDTAIFRKKKEAGFSVEVANGIYILDTYKDTIIKQIIESDLLKRKKYKYSDVGMYLLREIIEEVSGVSFDKYCDSVFYQPMHLKHTLFNPLTHFNSSQIAPTENDTYFRHQLIRGYVHDQGAAMMGGVSGHAGLFSNATDMASVCQMWLQQGNYGGIQYVDTAVLKDFTRQQFPLNHNRRGLGFDKPVPLHQDIGPTCPEVSSQSYGHSGFTGTYFWVDPEYDVIYIFLSNRVNPDAENRKLITMNIRTKIQEEIYRQLGISL